MGLREWLVVVGILVLVGILMDGYRRMRKAKQFAAPEEESYVDPEEERRQEQIRHELPNGGARRLGEFPPHARQQPAPPQTGTGESEEAKVFDDDPVPLLHDSVAPGGKPDPATLTERAKQIREEFSYDRGFAEAAQEQSSTLQAAAATEPHEPAAKERLDEDEQNQQPETSAVAESTPETEEPAADESSAPDNGAAQPRARVKPQLGPGALAELEARKVRAALAQAQEMIVINVMARDEAGFSGPELLHIILACGLRYGEMNIFHRYEDDPEGALQFSMANAIKPGEFDLEAMDQFTTPGVTFIMPLPSSSNNMQTFTYMLETANCLAKNLNGELQDEERSVMTAQTIEHCRQRIREFERRLLSKAQG